MDSRSDFLSLFIQHQDEILAFICATVRDHHASQDILQEVAIVLWERFADYDHSRSFAAWARGIAVRKMRQHWEKSRRMPLLASEEVLESLVKAYDATEPQALRQAEALRLCMDELSASARRLLELRYEKSLSLSRIAEIVASTLAATQKTLSRIRIRLQRCVEKRMMGAGR